HANQLCVRPVFLYLYVPTPSAIYPLSLHDALPISSPWPTSATVATPAISTVSTRAKAGSVMAALPSGSPTPSGPTSTPKTDQKEDRKSTRLNSSHVKISYAVCCFKKQNIKS